MALGVHVGLLSEGVIHALVSLCAVPIMICPHTLVPCLCISPRYVYFWLRCVHTPLCESTPPALSDISLEDACAQTQPFPGATKRQGKHVQWCRAWPCAAMHGHARPCKQGPQVPGLSTGAIPFPFGPLHTLTVLCTD